LQQTGKLHLSFADIYSLHASISPEAVYRYSLIFSGD
jgi:hypothetical protein